MTTIEFLIHYDSYPDGLSVGEIAYILEITKPTARMYIKSGKLESYRIGKRYIVSKAALKQFINSCKYEANTNSNNK